MNPLAQAAIGSILRFGLAALAGFLVKNGIWTQSESETYVAASALAIIALGWSLYRNSKVHTLLMVALHLPAGATVQDAKQIADGK